MDRYTELKHLLWGAGEEAIKAIVDDVSEITRNHYSNENRKIGQHDIITDYCTDLQNDQYNYGLKCVYAWVDGNGQLFYIGKGTLERAMQIGCGNRSKEFTRMADENARLFLIVRDGSEEAVADIEDVLIKYSAMHGAPLVNRHCIPSLRELANFMRLKAGETIKNDADEKSYDDLKNRLEWYEKVKEKFDKFLSMLDGNEEQKISNFPTFKKYVVDVEEESA